jgi:hypothetical protein
MRIDGVLGKNRLALIQTEFSGPQTVWYHLPVTANNDDAPEPWGGSFSHLIFKEDAGPVSPLYDIALNLLLDCLDREGHGLHSLYRIRLGLITRTPHPVVYPGHIDDDRPHRTGLFYVIDSDGDTLIYNERKKSNTYTEYERSSPQANSWYSFDGTRYHSATSPTANERRIVLTYNYKIN